MFDTDWRVAMPKGPDGERCLVDAVGRAVTMANAATGEIENPRESPDNLPRCDPFALGQMRTGGYR